MKTNDVNKLSEGAAANELSLVVAAHGSAHWVDAANPPDEGVDVLCYWGEHCPMEVGLYSGEAKNGEQIWQSSNGDMHEFDAPPTHWMRLPDAPND